MKEFSTKELKTLMKCAETVKKIGQEHEIKSIVELYIVAYKQLRKEK